MSLFIKATTDSTSDRNKLFTIAKQSAHNPYVFGININLACVDQEGIVLEHETFVWHMADDRDACAFLARIIGEQTGAAIEVSHCVA